MRIIGGGEYFCAHCNSPLCVHAPSMLPPWAAPPPREEETWLPEEAGFLHALDTPSSLGPQESFDPDLDEVDEKFIDSLLNSTPLGSSCDNTSSASSGVLPQTSSYPPSPPFWPPGPSSMSSSSPNNVIYHHNSSIQAYQSSGSLDAPPSCPPVPPKAASQKPQFRWRRRKRRSKAQYPEMSRYLHPIDSGEEVQHLGRTLECTLCGLRGKRCHLTLHFKAKHAEVIEFDKKGKGEVKGGGQTPQNGSGGKVKIFELEEALGKAFLFLKDTLEDDSNAGEDVSSERHLLLSGRSPLENACMKKINSSPTGGNSTTSHLSSSLE